jgi:endoglucanase
VTVHYYLPMAFTHQDAWWVPNSSSWHGTSWGDESQHEAVRRDLGAVAAWALLGPVPERSGGRLG